jgi:hypothetical protein
MGKSNSLPPAGHYNANYGNFQTELYAQIRCEAFGRGYWTKTVGSPQTSRTGVWSGSTGVSHTVLRKYKTKVGNSLESQDLR